MNFASTDGLEPTTTNTPTRRDDPQPARVHYTNEFHIYQKQRENGTGVTKRARCNHCQGDWAYNETRLKNHIIDPYRGCRRIPQEARDRVRNADTSNHQTSTQPPITPSSSLPTHNTTPVTPGPPVKRKRETAILTTTPIQNQPIVAPADSDMLVGIGSTAEPQVTNQVRVAVEFSMTNATVHRATWIAAELLTEFQRELFDVSLIPKQTDDIFNIYIGGKVAWSRVPGQPLPDYEHLRPMVRAQCCHANIKVELTGGLR